MMGHEKALLAVALAATVASAASAERLAVMQFGGAWRHVESSEFKSAPAPPTKILRGSGGGIEFRIRYDDVEQDTGIGFDDPAEGATRRATLEAVLVHLDSILDNDGVLDVAALASENNGSATLATGSTYYRVINGFTGGLSLEHLTTGVDQFPEIPDMQITVNFGATWNSGIGHPRVDQYDLFTVLLHEAAHGLGVASLTTSQGSSAIQSGTSPTFTFSNYDKLLFAASGSRLWDGSPPTIQVPASVLAGGQGAAFLCASNVGGSIGFCPGIHTPTRFVQGSSISHWDSSARQDGAPALMTPAIPRNYANRTFRRFERALLRDLGYTLAPGALDDPARGIVDRVLGMAAGGTDLNLDGKLDCSDIARARTP